jgi:F0F1-type ATP synthase assembly protein I
MAKDPMAPDRPPGGEGNSPKDPSFLDFMALGTACALSIIVAGGLGYLLDDRFGTSPWLTLGGLAFGITAAILITVHRIRPFL